MIPTLVLVTRPNVLEVSFHGTSPAWQTYTLMMLNEPMTSSGRWRAPTHSAAPVADARPALAVERTLRATVARRVAQSRPLARHASHALTVALLVGGVLVAPVMALLALVSLFAPFSLAPRSLAPALIFIALLWLALAIFGAHIQAEREAASNAPRDPHQ